MNQLPAVGIDLGTTYSALAIVDEHGQPHIVPNAEGERLTPSAVFFDQDTIVVGQIAKDAMVTHPDRVVTFIKRQMGNGSWFYSHKGERQSPIDISAHILKKLKQDAEQQLDRALPYAVITVPAYFDDARRRMTQSAGELAGFQVLELLNEPTAAAIAFGIERSQKPEMILVYDLGGGTFDVTIMRVEGKNIRVLSTDGANELGGKDFDDALIRHVAAQFTREHGNDPTLDPFIANEVRTAAEKAKRELSARAKTTIMLRANGNTTRLEVTREQFQELIKLKLDTTPTILRSALKAAALTPEQIDRVLLIGGSTRVPAVRALLHNFFGKEPDASVNPDEAVALGAAIMAAKKFAELDPAQVSAPIKEKTGDLIITDVTSHSFGIEAVVPGTPQKINAILIPRNSPIPTQVSKEFITSLQGQTAIRVKVYQGEFQEIEKVNPIGEFTLGGLPPERSAGRKIRVTMACDKNGVVNITALDIETGKQATTEVSYQVGMTTEQKSAKSKWHNAQKIE